VVEVGDAGGQVETRGLGRYIVRLLLCFKECFWKPYCHRGGECWMGYLSCFARQHWALSWLSGGSVSKWCEDKSKLRVTWVPGWQACYGSWLVVAAALTAWQGLYANGKLKGLQGSRSLGKRGKWRRSAEVGRPRCGPGCSLLDHASDLHHNTTQHNTIRNTAIWTEFRPQELVASIGKVSLQR